MSALPILSTQSLTSVLPYNPSKKKHGDLKTGLREYQFLLKSVIQANYSLENSEFEKFDSLVGENACQIRVLKIALLTSKYFIDFSPLNIQSLKAQRKIDELCLPKTAESLMRGGDSLEEVLGKYELDLALTTDEMFVLQAYLLTEAKEQQPEQKVMNSLFRIDKANPNNLISGTTSSFRKTLVRKLRTLLSEASVQFMRETASKLEDLSLMKMFSKEYVIEHNNCLCVPIFWSMKAMLKMAQKEGLPLVIHTKFLETLENGYRVKEEEFLLYKPSKDPENLSYIESILNASDLEKPACFIQGVACVKNNASSSLRDEWKKAILKQPITDVILAAAADHRQYPDPDQVLSIEDREYEKYKLLAETGGFSSKNPTTFLTQHVYVQKLSKMFK